MPHVDSADGSHGPRTPLKEEWKAGEKCDNTREELEQRREKAVRERGRRTAVSRSHEDRKLTGSRKHDIQSGVQVFNPNLGANFALRGTIKC